jgi:hypothetical protein
MSNSSKGSLFVWFHILLKVDSTPVDIDIKATLINFVKDNPKFSAGIKIDEKDFLVKKGKVSYFVLCFLRSR